MTAPKKYSDELRERATPMATIRRSRVSWTCVPRRCGPGVSAPRSAPVRRLAAPVMMLNVSPIWNARCVNCDGRSEARGDSGDHRLSPAMGLLTRRLRFNLQAFH